MHMCEKRNKIHLLFCNLFSCLVFSNVEKDFFKHDLYVGQTQLKNK